MSSKPEAIALNIRSRGLPQLAELVRWRVGTDPQLCRVLEKGLARDFLSPAEVALVCGLATGSVHTMLKSGQLGYTQFGQRFRVGLSDLERFLQRHRHPVNA